MPAPISVNAPSALPDPLREAYTGPPPAVVTLDPVYIEGDAGTQKLIAQHDSRQRVPDCRAEKRDVTTSSIALAGGAMLAVGTLATGGALAVAGTLLCLVGLGIDTGSKVHQLQDCDKP